MTTSDLRREGTRISGLKSVAPPGLNPEEQAGLSTKLGRSETLATFEGN
jgi:hypothetical protein